MCLPFPIIQSNLILHPAQVMLRLSIMDTIIIVNPRCGKLRSRGGWPSLESRLRAAIGPFETRLTESVGDGAVKTREALYGGAQRVIAVGGDGTLGEVADGFFENGRPITYEARFGFIMCGTGNDFQKTLGRGKGMDRAIAALKTPREKRIDLGRITYTDHEGNRASRCFLNIASFGMSGEVDRRVRKVPLRGLLGGKLSFLLASASALMSFRNKPVRLIIDDQIEIESLVRLVVVANGRYAGGGMLFAPSAEIDDGLFDIVMLEDVSAAQSVRHMGRIYRGAHLGLDHVGHLQGHKLEATSQEEVLVDVDGEPVGRLPATFEILPEALLVEY